MSIHVTHQSIAQALVEVADGVRRSTVQVRGQRWGAGAGVIWQVSPLNPSNVIITNAHVVRGSSVVVEVWDGRTLEATVVARDLQHDLAALTVDASDLTAAIAGNSNQLRVGELVLAVGNPWGLVGALTTGIVHTVCPSEGDGWIQADVRLAPGNSGGPLANAQGEVIGINTMIVNGLAIAIPSHTVHQFLKTALIHSTQVDVA
ncbi:MAG: trypsin-like peptidase domain-containing protein [Oculatellaceae cyanobacterium bins.114]|nr:trypsin-like peptidase domain-containing protein [Oculatellaceae cyanobacterium bins.114]